MRPVLGSVVRMRRFDMASMKFYSEAKAKGVDLICPCKISFSQRFILEKPYDATFAILSLESDREKIAILSWDCLESYV